MTTKRTLFQFLLWIVSFILLLLGIVSGSYGIDQIKSTPIFGVIFLSLGTMFLYSGYRLTGLNIDYVAESAKKRLPKTRIEAYTVLVLTIVVGFIYLTGTFNFIDNFIKIPKISYNYLFLMAFFWPVMGSENIIFILSIYSRYTLNIPLIEFFLTVLVWLFEMVYLLFLSRLLVRLLIILRDGRHKLL